MTYQTREQWLNAGVLLLTPLFERLKRKVPKKLRVSCGFPSRNAFGRRQADGECWSDKASAGKVFEIFISPILNKPVDVLDCLTHELVHATVGLEHKHGGDFKKVALAIGLEGKMTSASAGKALLKELRVMADSLGAYPHDKLDQMTNGKKKEGCRLLPASCPSCGYKIRVTRKWLEVGLPTCPCGEDFVEGDGE